MYKRFRREKTTRRKLQACLDLENKRRAHLEEALRTVEAADQIDTINEKLSLTQEKPIKVAASSSSSVNNSQNPSPHATATSFDLSKRVSESLPEQRFVKNIKQEHEDPPGSGYGQQAQRNLRELLPLNSKPWGYSGIGLMNTEAGFWQNYSDSLAQELEMERKSRQQQVERDVKSPLQDRSGYYKNSVLFTGSAT